MLATLILGTLMLKAQPCPVTVGFTHTPTCVQGVVQFNGAVSLDSGYIVNWIWDFGDGSPMGNTPDPLHTFAASGQYQVMLSVFHSDGCLVSVTKSIVVSQSPNVDFIADDVCYGDPVAFQNQSYPGTVGFASWFWDFGDGTNSSLETPSHVYSSTGIKTVILYAVDNNGCNHSAVKQVEIFEIPVSSPSWVTNCSGNLIQFNDNSTSVNGGIISWLWDFGDGSYSVQTNPVHYFAGTGMYTITLTVADPFGCSGITSLPLVVVDAIDLSFQSDTVCLGEVISFTGVNNTPGTSVNTWTWDFGDGTITSGQSVSHQYQAAGNFMINLTAEDQNGCQYTLGKAASVLMPPQAAFTNNTVFFGDTTTFADVSTPGANAISQRTWDFGDGTPPLTTTAAQVKHLYLSPGNYNVAFMAQDIKGCQDDNNQLVDVWSNYLKAAWVADTVCEGEITEFQDQTMVGSGGVVSWNWRFGDGTTSQQQNPSHTYYVSGVYHVVLSVMTNIGVIDSAQAYVVVNPRPMASFDPSSICVEDKKIFSNTSTISSGSIVSWLWDLGDGYMSTLHQPEKVYYATGNHQVSLIVRSDLGCTDTIVQPFNVYARPLVDFVANKYQGCGSQEITFTDKSTISQGFVQTWSWDFGDGGVSSNPGQLKHTYTTVGSYSVGLTVVSNHGCAASKTVYSMIHIRPVPVSDFTFDPVDAEITRPTVFFANHSVGADFYKWNFGDGNSTSAFNPVHNFTKEGVYTITLVAETNFGCIDASSKTIRVTAEPTLFVPDAFTPNGDGINDLFAPAGYAYQSDDGKTMVFQIFTRTGQIIYDSSQNPNPWDGRIMGSTKTAPTGVYVCKVVCTDFYGKKLEQISRLTLYR